ncbi:hypothetical protein CONLIGDRAFT_579185 [Coniochaeta ligniaria NRRL 30616]|uniref:AB hydrolase-1 domain-containing protein n=1 Tax=Coniochaeta ligniaria NRRL 30616 TaxID=1408157 RepID=A0A1J7JEH8_9PEZI|nr:hypothetical protein CONLIGDRAFT_579185 [Coniochaeta ligniaria NRRL 30616]
MLDHSVFQLLQIRAAIILLAHAPWLELGILISLIASKAILYPYEPPSRAYLISVSALTGFLALELVFYIIKYVPHLDRLQRNAQHPAPLTRKQRLELFEKCAANIPDPESYVRLWCHGAEMKDIKRDNVAEFILWAFFDRGAVNGDGPLQGPGPDDDDITAELEHYVSRTEDLLGYKLPPGRGPATCLRLTIDAIEQRYRSLLWYTIVAGVDLTTHICLARDGFQYHGPPLRKALAVFPPRLQVVPTLLPFPRAKRYSSASEHIGFWIRPHTARNARPVVFIHGIGVGLWPYTRFLDEIGRPTGSSSRSGGEDDGQIGVIVLEILPISTRLTDPPLRREAFVQELRAILAANAPEWLDDGFVLVSHSYGSVLTTHIIRDPDLAPHVRGVVLIDPVTLLLHLPDVAYNFTRRPPQTANEWQLWFFASMDVGVAEGLGRHFFWRENEVWKEELVGKGVLSNKGSNGIVTRSKAQDQTSTSSPAVTKRQVAVCLGGRDLIVNTQTVAHYLARTGDMADTDASEEQAAIDAFESPRCTRYLGPSGVEILWFPTLDHAQVFDAREDRQQILDVIEEYCSLESAT